MGTQSMAESKIVWAIKADNKYYGPFASMMVASDWADASTEVRGPYEYIEIKKPINWR